MNYVFPSTDAPRLAVAVAQRMAEYLRAGNTDPAVTGFNTAPTFSQSGASVQAQVLLPDETAPQGPYVQIMEVRNEGGSERAGEQRMSRWMIVIEAHSNGATVAGEPGDMLLASAVWRLVDHYKAMDEWGFNNPQSRLGAPGRIENRDAVEYRYFATVTFDIYIDS